MKRVPRIVFRADARVDLGTGHVMRCLTLARYMSSSGWDVSFVTLEQSCQLCPGLSDFPLNVVPADATISDETSLLKRAKADVIVVDHYERDASLETPLRKHAFVLAIDDLADRRHDCDALLDQTPGRVLADYAPWINTPCQTFLGGDYALLRTEFLELRARSLARRISLGVPRTLLVTCGGTDPKGASLVVLDALALTRHKFDVTLILPPASPIFERVQASVNSWSHQSTVTLLGGTSDMAELMVKADIAIGAGGTTSWERCCLGLPCLNLKIAENQTLVNRVLTKQGAVIDLGAVEDLKPEKLAALLDGLCRDTERLRQMSKAASDLIDGRGCSRIGQGLAQLVEVSS